MKQSEIGRSSDEGLLGSKRAKIQVERCGGDEGVERADTVGGSGGDGGWEEGIHGS